MKKEKYSIQVLNEAADIQRKEYDHQNKASRIKQADHYPRGCSTILDMVHQKITRMYSVIETMESGGEPNFESIRYSALDGINYLSFFVSYMDGRMDGQSAKNDMFNKAIDHKLFDSLKISLEEAIEHHDWNKPLFINKQILPSNPDDNGMLYAYPKEVLVPYEFGVKIEPLLDEMYRSCGEIDLAGLAVEFNQGFDLTNSFTDNNKVELSEENYGSEWSEFDVK